MKITVFLILLVFNGASAFGVCSCVSSLGANNRKSDDSFWSAGNCLGGKLTSSCNTITGDGDCTLTCDGCDYQATDAGAFETGCFSDAGCTLTPCSAIPELGNVKEIWANVKVAWILVKAAF